MDKRCFLTTAASVLGAAACLAAAPAAFAQAYPTKAIRIVVPYAAGGTSDILARTLAVRVGEALGQQLLVENRPGANGVLGADLVAKAAPDGYTLLLADLSGLTSAPAVMGKLPFDAAKDFAPVTMIAYSPHLVVVPAGSSAQTLADVVTQAKAKRGGFNFATVGAGSATHLAGALFARRAGVEWTYVPYKGGAQALNDLSGGQADLMFNGMLATLPYVTNKKLHAVAISGERRWPTLPDLPTVAEQGYPGFVTGSWQGLVAPAATPAPVVERLAVEFGRALAQPDVRERLVAQGAEPRPMRPDQLGEFLRIETTRWGQLVKETGIKAE